MSIGSGNVPITIEGEEKFLVPTYGAATRISKAYGGYMPAIQAVGNLDMEAMELVVAHGLQLTVHGQKGLGEKIYASGMVEVAAACVKYLNILMNGGKPRNESDVEAEDRESEGEA